MERWETTKGEMCLMAHEWALETPDQHYLTAVQCHLPAHSLGLWDVREELALSIVLYTSALTLSKTS